MAKNAWFFKRTIAALVSGEAGKVLRRENPCDVVEIQDVFLEIRSLGLERVSRRGWYTLEYPELGTVQWKTGADFRTGGWYFFLRVNGYMVLRAWPEADGRETFALWVAPVTAKLAKGDVVGVERFLGTLQKGSRMTPGERELLPTLSK